MNFIVPYVIYPFEVMFSFGETDKELFAALKIWGVNKRDKMYKYGDGEDAITVKYDEGLTLIRISDVPKTPEEFSILQHEIFHAISYVMLEVGIILSKESEESYSYLVAYLTNQAYIKIFEQNNPVNHEKETI